MRHGYCIVPWAPAAEQCELAVSMWATAKSFRFPQSADESSQLAAPPRGMNYQYRRAFNELYDVAAYIAFACRPNELPPVNAAFGARPFAPHSTGTTPFEVHTGAEPPFCPEVAGDVKRSELPYAGSFCSIFNFDHGFLNEHHDRGLLTAIYGRAPRDVSACAEDQVRLWAR